VYGRILQHSRESGVDHNIHAYSNFSQKQKETPLKRLGEYMYTDVKNREDRVLSNAQNAKHPSPTHTFWEDTYTQVN
jgi:hypothetical protein